jgi:hypothetical protein
MPEMVFYLTNMRQFASRYFVLKKRVPLIHKSMEGNGKPVIEVFLVRSRGETSFNAHFEGEGYTAPVTIDKSEARRLIQAGGIERLESWK